MDTYDFLVDPRAITLAERRTTAKSLQREQDAWLERLRADPQAPGLSHVLVLGRDIEAPRARELVAQAQRRYIPVAHLMQLIGSSAPSPQPTPDVEAFLAADSAMREAGHSDANT